MLSDEQQLKIEALRAASRSGIKDYETVFLNARMYFEFLQGGKDAAEILKRREDPVEAEVTRDSKGRRTDV